jgi:hypothetical protein
MLWITFGERFDLEQSHGRHAQDGGHSFHAVGRRILAPFEIAASLESFVKLFSLPVILPP